VGVAVLGGMWAFNKLALHLCLCM